MKLSFKVISLLWVTLLCGTATAASVSIKNNHMKFDGTQYYRGGAIDVQLGSYGQKKVRAGGVNKLAVEKNIDASILAKYGNITAHAVSIDWSRVKTKNLGVSGKFMGKKGTHKLNRNNANKYNLKLVKFTIKEGHMKDILNRGKPHRAKTYMSNQGKKARVCNTVWMVMSAQYANAFSGADKIILDSRAKLTAYRGTKKTANVTLSQGTTFAYGLFRVKRWAYQGKKLEVFDLEEDEWGIH